MNTHLKNILPAIFFLFLISIWYFFESNRITKNSSPLEVIPSNASLIIELRKGFEREILIPSAKDSLPPIFSYQRLQENLETINSIINQNRFSKDKNIFLSMHTIKNRDIYLISLSIDEEELKRFQKSNRTIKTTKFNDVTIFQCKIKSKNFYYSYKKNIAFGSYKKEMLQKAISSIKKGNVKEDIGFNRVRNREKDNRINIYYNLKKLSSLKEIANKYPISNTSEWASTNIIAKNKEINLIGSMYYNDNENQFVNLLQNEKTYKLTINHILPYNTTEFLSMSFSEKINQKRKRYLKRKNNYSHWEDINKLLIKDYNFNLNEFVKYVNEEIGYFKFKESEKKDNQFLFIRCSNLANAKSLLQRVSEENNNTEHYHINKLSNEEIIPNFYKRILSTPKKIAYYTHLKTFKNHDSENLNISGYIIFSDNINDLKKIRRFYNNGRTLNQNPHYLRFQKNQESNYNLTYYRNNNMILFGQLRDEGNYLTTTLRAYYKDSISQDQRPKKIHKIIWGSKLENKIQNINLIEYNKFENHIILEDIDNNIMCYTSKGDLIWRKRISEKIIGEISRIRDKKGNAQYLFNTNNKLHYIKASNGNDIINFPKNLPSPTNISHSVFDYKKNGNYRIFIVGEDNRVYNLKKNGEERKDWKYENRNQSSSKQSIQYFKKNQEYLIDVQGKSIRLLHRRGHVKLSFDIENSKIPVYYSNERIITINKNGDLWIGETNGDFTENTLEGLDTNSIFIISNIDHNKSKEYIYTNKNNLYIINSKLKTLLKSKFDNTIKDINVVKIKKNHYITVYTEKNKLFVIKNNGKILKGFPINIEEHYICKDLDDNGKLNIVNTKSGSLYNIEIDVNTGSTSSNR